MSGRVLASLTAFQVHELVDTLLLEGKAESAWEAEEQFLDSHLDEIAELATILPMQQFREHAAVKLLLSHGSRPWEDEVL